MAILLLIAGCAGVARPPVQSVPETPAAIPPASVTAPAAPASPTEQAAASLVAEGRQLLERGRGEAAMRRFEQAIALHRGDYRAYYYLAEAWGGRGGIDQALEFNRLAALHAAHDAAWRGRIAAQREALLAGGGR